MFRHAAIAGLLLAFTSSAFAAPLDPGESPAMKLVRNGLSGSGTQVEGKPAFGLDNSVVDLVLNLTKLADLAKAIGVTTHRAGNSGDPLDWLCVASPEADGQKPALLWFVSQDVGAGPGLLTAVAVEAVPATLPDGCESMKAPFGLELGIPGVGASLADVSAKFGAPSEREPDGTIGFFYAGTRKAGKEGIISSEIKYAFDGDVVTAVAVSEFFELD